MVKQSQVFDNCLRVNRQGIPMLGVGQFRCFIGSMWSTYLRSPTLLLPTNTKEGVLVREKLHPLWSVVESRNMRRVCRRRLSFRSSSKSYCRKEVRLARSTCPDNVHSAR